MKYITRIIIGLAIVVMTGCIQSNTVITVKSDGSGTIEETTGMSAEAVAQLNALASMGGDKTKGKGPDMFDEVKLRAAAKKMGPGVRFVSSTPFKNAQIQGVKALYAFDDVTKIRLEQKPSGLDSSPDTTVEGRPKEELLFKFGKSAAGNPVVTVVFPGNKFEEAKSKAKEQAADPSAAGAMEMMKQILKGMRIAIALRVDGRIIKTNSQYVDGPQITLLDIDFDQLTADPKILEKMGQPNSLEEAKVMLKGVKGVKVTLDKEVMVEFAGR